MDDCQDMGEGISWKIFCHHYFGWVGGRGEWVGYQY